MYSKFEIEECFRDLMAAYNDFKRMVRVDGEGLYAQWRAGGFLIDESVVSMYPNATKVFERLLEMIEEETEGDEEKNE